MATKSKWNEIKDKRAGGDSAVRERNDAAAAVERELLEIGERLQELREKRDTSQATLADALGVSQPNVSRIEREADIKLATLASYIGGLGGELEIVAKFDDEAVHLTDKGMVTVLGRKGAGKTTGKPVDGKPKTKAKS